MSDVASSPCRVCSLGGALSAPRRNIAPMTCLMSEVARRKSLVPAEDAFRQQEGPRCHGWGLLCRSG